MAAQDVREFIPRVRRAIEGPVPLATGALTDDQIEALAADSIADVILLTVAMWPHKLLVTERSAPANVPIHWEVDPGLSLEEESVIAAQAAITYFFHEVKDKKVSETITNEGQSWDYEISGPLLRDQIKLLQQQRDAALKAVTEAHPVMARYASILEIRDRVGSALLEQWTRGGIGGGQETAPNVWLPG
jgi:hypothetical protein